MEEHIFYAANSKEFTFLPQMCLLGCFTGPVLVVELLGVKILVVTSEVAVI